MKRYRFIGLLFFIVSLLSISCNNANLDQQIATYTNGNFISELNQTLTEAIIGDLFPPPVASRIYAYPNIAVYEIMRYADVELPSMANKLNALTPLPKPDNVDDINLELAALTAFVKVSKSLVYTESGLLDFEKHKSDSIENLLDENIFKTSIDYGNQVAEHILAWIATDNYKETRAGVRYSLLKAEGSWLPTPPDYTPAIEPHWQELRPFIIQSADVFRPDSLKIAYSSSVDSDFYKEAMAVYKAVLNADSNQISMAMFWDDNPVVSEHTGHMMVKNKKMTPGGHWMYITMIGVEERELDMPQAALIFSLTSISLADAFIASWDGKYHFHLIRPVTYINNFIDSGWAPILQTPPFPEHPSAHSAVSAAAAHVLTSYFGDNFAFTDSSEVRFNLPVRSFTSFNEAAKEVALSRYYGGIHFPFSNEGGVIIGKKVGMEVTNKLLTQQKSQ